MQKVKKMKSEKLMDLYSDFLMTSPNVVSALLMEDVLEKAHSHDSITRMLSQHELDQKEYWKQIKPMVRQLEDAENGLISIDDTIKEKPYTDENELVAWHHDHSKKGNDKMVKGIQILTFTYVSSFQGNKVIFPIGFDLVRKDLRKEDAKTKKIKRVASVSKNEMLQNRLKTLAHINNVQFRYVAWDSWFSSADNMCFVAWNIKRHFICPIKDNRTISFDLDMTKKQSEKQWESVSQTKFETNQTYQVCLKDVPFPVLLVKQVFHNLDGSIGEQYLVTSDLDLSPKQIEDTYGKRWSSEELHRSLKQNTALEKMPAKKADSQANHIFASMLAQTKLESIKMATKQNHYALKRTILLDSLKKAWAEIQKLKELALNNYSAFPNFRAA